MDGTLLIPIIVPFIVFASIVLVIATPFYFRHRNRRVLFEAIKAQVEKTGQADPKLIDAITVENVGPNGDLRRGILLFSIAAALAAIYYIADTDPLVLGIAALPGLSGLAYIAFHYFIPREPTI